MSSIEQSSDFKAAPVERSGVAGQSVPPSNSSAPPDRMPAAGTVGAPGAKPIKWGWWLAGAGVSMALWYVGAVLYTRA